MKKAIFKALSIALVLVMCLSVSMIASAESAWYYEAMDFSESSASSHIYNNMVADGISIEDGAVKITSIVSNKSSGNRQKSSRIRFFEDDGSQLYLTPQTTYRISFDMNVESTTAPILLGVKRNNKNTFTDDASSAITKFDALGGEIAADNAAVGAGYKRYSFEFENTATADNGNQRILLCFYTRFSSSANYSCEIYIDNIVIEEKVAITYSGDADATGLPTTAWAGQTYADVLGEAAGNWYTDAECNTVASGVINNNAVTLYGKAPAADPSFGVEVSTKAGLFIGGKDASTNAGIAGISDNSAVYVGDDGTEYTAFRVYGTYVAPDKGDGTPDFGKVVLDAEGNTADLVSRHVMLGYNVANAEDLTIENNFAKSETATFDKCWKYEENDDGSFTVTYSLLLKDIPKDYVSTTFSVRSAVVTDDGAIYSADMLTGISALATYNGVKDTVDYTIGWFAE